jgi:hypothetical protein
MSAPVMYRANYGDHFGSAMLPVLEEIFNSRLGMHPSRRSELFKLVSHDRDIWQSSEVHDIDLFNQMAEGEEYSFSRPKQGASKTFTVLKYGLGFSISEEMVDDGKFSWIQDAVAKLADSAKETQEISAMNVFNNAFAGSLTADGQYLCDSDHSLPSGLTFSNLLSAAADLSPSSLDTALTAFKTNFIGDSGIKKNLMPKVLLVAPANERYAREIVGSDLKADTADNNLNPFKQDGLRVVVSPHLTDDDAWFLLSSPEQTGLRIIQRKPIETKAAGPDVGFKTDSILYKARYREVLGAIHPYGVFGTPGA